jgi:hypothetical protein
MHGLVGCCYVPCDDDDESQGFVPVAGRALHFFRVAWRCTFYVYLATRRREPRFRSGRRLLHFFRVSGRRDDPRRCSGELGEVGAGAGGSGMQR